MVKVLTSLPGKQATGTKQTGGKAGPVLSSDIQVVADAETNALIITAPREEYLVLEDVIKKLDIPRRMVYMEALIMEVQVSKDFGLGVQYGGSGTFADETGTLFGGFSGESGDNAYGILGGLSQMILPFPAVLPWVF